MSMSEALNAVGLLVHKLQVKAILTAVRNKPHPARCIMVSATMTKAVRRLIGERRVCLKEWMVVGRVHVKRLCPLLAARFRACNMAGCLNGGYDLTVD